MLGEQLEWEYEWTDTPIVPNPQGSDPLEDWDDLEPGPQQNDVWDAFELDDDLTDPQPEYGDFWPELDDETI